MPISMIPYKVMPFQVSVSSVGAGGAALLCAWATPVAANAPRRTSLHQRKRPLAASVLVAIVDLAQVYLTGSLFKLPDLQLRICLADVTPSISQENSPRPFVAPQPRRDLTPRPTRGYLPCVRADIVPGGASCGVLPVNTQPGVAQEHQQVIS